MSLDHFNNLLTQLSSMSDSRVRSRRVALAIFLAKMRLNLSNAVVASMLHLKG